MERRGRVLQISAIRRSYFSSDSFLSLCHPERSRRISAKRCSFFLLYYSLSRCRERVRVRDLVWRNCLMRHTSDAPQSLELVRRAWSTGRSVALRSTWSRVSPEERLPTAKLTMIFRQTKTIPL